MFHRHPTAFFVAALTLLVAAPALAQESESFTGAKDAQRLCRYLESVAASERALLVAPDLFGRVGLVQGGLDDAGDASLAFQPSARVTAGLRYSLRDLSRGNLRRDIADAECQRAVAAARIESFIDATEAVDMTAVYEAQLVAAESALADARRMLATMERVVDAQRATELELRALRARINRYESTAHDIRARIAAEEPVAVEAPEAKLETLVADVIASEVALEKERSALRKNAAWDVQVAGGYDQTFGYDVSLPVFATVSFAWNFGRIWQGDHERAAIDARRAMHEESEDSWESQLERVGERLERIGLAEADKLADVRAMLADVRQRRDEMRGVGTATALRYADQLALDAWDLEIERSYLFAYLELISQRLEALGREVPKPIVDALKVADVGAVDARLIHFTNGESEPIGKAAVRVNTAKSRATFDNSDGDSGKITFTYEGPSGNTTKLGSGTVRRQIGLKLRAKNGCNLLYVMWRIEPPEGIVVSVKRNDGQTIHVQCGNRGYTNLKPDESSEPPSVKPGDQHTLEARLRGGELVVWADSEVVWRKKVDAEQLPFDGPAGIRTDNGIFTIAAEAPRANRAKE